MSVRVRYAPSPTGTPHVGNIRTALYCWLAARHYVGEFILRIEDTDRARYDERAYDGIVESLRWLGLDWDEGPEAGGPHEPYFQSQRLELYQNGAQALVERGHAYRCFCSPERLQEVREAQQKVKQPPRYDRRCRALTDAEREAKLAEGTPSVVRFATPDAGETSFDDIVRGRVTFDNATLDDFVVLKSDGFPTGVFSHVVDDHLMEITHVLRGEEWVSTTPRQVLAYQALGWEPPRFAHLSTILGPDKAKLSKRHGAVSALDYRDEGFLPEAMFNFLGLLGWSLDDHTVIISRDEFVQHFTFDRLVKNPAVFDSEKLHWMNGVYLREHIPEERLIDLVAERLEAELPPDASRPVDRDTVRQLVPLVRERMQTLREVTGLVEGFFTDELSYGVEELLGKRFRNDASAAQETLQAARERLDALPDWSHETLEETLRGLAQERDLKPGDLFMLLRVACTGRPVSPPLFESMQILGRERCLQRVDAALAHLGVAG